MTQSPKKFLLVGTQFSQGAVAILAKGTAQRTKVRLEAEPGNPYDPLAVRVLIDRAAVVSSDDLAEALGAFGLSLDAIAWPFHLGHLGASRTTKAAKAAALGGVKFDVVEEWHKLAEGERAVGRLVFEGFGPVTVEVDPGEAAEVEVATPPRPACPYQRP